jgi:uncharacterized protein YggE
VKKRFTSSVGMLVVGLLALALAACTSAQAAPQAVPAGEAQEMARYITVVGIGEVSLTPDVAEVNIGAEVSAETVSEAKAEVDRRVEAIVALLKEMGIADKDIQTSHYSIYYDQERYPVAMESMEREGISEASGVYRVSSMLRVTIRDLEQVGEALDAAIEAGANQVYGVMFTVSDDEKWEGEAREKAVADAKARAEELARLSGVELGEVLSVSEVVGSTPMVVREAAMAYGGGGIALGELEFSSQIQVTFAIQ